MNPTFSIIVTSFNYATYIGEAIGSVLAQTFDDWELLIVDDCSTDNSWDIIQSFDDPRIKASRHAVNMGACAAYNTALSIASGRYIACLDSDDLFLPNKLERQAEFMANHPSVDICGTFVTEIDRNSIAVSENMPYADWFNTSTDLNAPENWIWQNRLCHSSTVVRAELHERLGEFDNRLVYTPDWQFWLRALVAGARFSIIDEVHVGYRNHGSNITHKKPQDTLLEHAETLANTLIPWLGKQRRVDLIEKILEGFVRHSALVAASELQALIISSLFSGTAAHDTGMAAMRVAFACEAELRANKLRTSEILQGKDWLESKYNELAAKESCFLEALKESVDLKSQLSEALNESKNLKMQLSAALKKSEDLNSQLQFKTECLDRIRATFSFKFLKTVGIIKDV